MVGRGRNGFLKKCQQTLGVGEVTQPADPHWKEGCETTNGGRKAERGTARGKKNTRGVLPERSSSASQSNSRGRLRIRQGHLGNPRGWGGGGEGKKRHYLK